MVILEVLTSILSQNISSLIEILVEYSKSARMQTGDTQEFILAFILDKYHMHIEYIYIM